MVKVVIVVGSPQVITPVLFKMCLSSKTYFLSLYEAASAKVDLSSDSPVSLHDVTMQILSSKILPKVIIISDSYNNPMFYARYYVKQHGLQSRFNWRRLKREKFYKIITF